MTTTTIPIGGMSCGGCVQSITRALAAVPGVLRTEISLERAQAIIEFDPDKVSQAQLAKAIEDAGYDVESRADPG